MMEAVGAIILVATALGLAAVFAVSTTDNTLLVFAINRWRSPPKTD